MRGGEGRGGEGEINQPRLAAASPPLPLSTSPPLFLQSPRSAAGRMSNLTILLLGDVERPEFQAEAERWAAGRRCAGWPTRARPPKRSSAGELHRR